MLLYAMWVEIGLVVVLILLILDLVLYVVDPSMVHSMQILLHLHLNLLLHLLLGQSTIKVSLFRGGFDVLKTFLVKVSLPVVEVALLVALSF